MLSLNMEVYVAAIPEIHFLAVPDLEPAVPDLELLKRVENARLIMFALTVRYLINLERFVM